MAVATAEVAGVDPAAVVATVEAKVPEGWSVEAAAWEEAVVAMAQPAAEEGGEGPEDAGS